MNAFEILLLTVGLPCLVAGIYLGAELQRRQDERDAAEEMRRRFRRERVG